MSYLNMLVGYFKLAAAYVKLNCKTQLEYRAAFISQAGAMILNDCAWLAFWCLFFDRFQVINGWGPIDVVTLWAVSAAGFGIAHTICGNALYLPGIIARGELDAWMLYPRALLPHLIVGRMSPSSVGDVIFGYMVYLVFARPDIPHFIMFVTMTFTAAVLFTAFSILSGSLSFFVGNAETLADQWRFALITFSTYPMGLFKGSVKLLLLTVIPAAFVNYFPMEALRHLSLPDAALAAAGSSIVLAVAVLVFYWGLNRYESGNAMGLRG